ncbi:MAG: preprotein translocase subunit SecG [Mycoplasmataceae bacterium]|jgi:preprotein translocase subunit SecG|nr:preprotein translocase subunit SecG [Mycoplasmataceae bacterium]
MTPVVIAMIVIAALIIVVGLFLSGSGSTTGLTAMSGQDLELFKKTKDRGMVKVLQIILFLLFLASITLIILAFYLKW